MAEETFRLREGSASDLAELTKLDGSISSEWVLYIERHGGTVEQTIELSWRKVKPDGSRRAFEAGLEEVTKDFNRSERLIIAEGDGRIAGFLMLGTNWNRTAELTAVFVDTAYRRRGLGERFVQEAEAYAGERGLRALQWETQTDNRDAIEFAVSQGFRIAGFHDGFYRNDGGQRQEAEDFAGIALFLTKELD